MLERTLDFDTTSITLNQWSDFEPYLADLEMLEKQGLRLLAVDVEAGIDNEMIVVYVAGLGFNLGLLGEDCTLCDPELSDEIVEYTHFGSLYSESRRCLVGRELMVEAARYFFETGGAAPQLSWVATR